MLLAIDVGNTQTTLGLFEIDGTLIKQWRMATDKTDTADELHERLFGFFLMFGLDLFDVRNVALASVVPILTQEWTYLLTNDLQIDDVLLVDATRDCGIEVALRDPASLGADRIANAVAAKIRFGAPVIVVDFGTATNIDVVNRDGAFCGGAIMPGILLSAQSLFSRASKLASVPLEIPPHALGDSTTTAVQSGIVLGAAAQAEGIVARIMAELSETCHGLGKDELTVVATGGFSHILAPATTLFDAIEPDLTVRGIFHIWEHRARKRKTLQN